MFRSISRSSLRSTGLLQSSIRPISHSTPRPFLQNLFGKKDVKQRDEIVKNQDDYEVDTSSKIVILDEKNSPDYKPFDASVDMPDFEIKKWKFNQVKPQDIETSYDNAKLNDVLITSYNELRKQASVAGPDQFASVTLDDLQFRFNYVKLLQQKLGFDISDYILTKSHTLQVLADELSAVINTRFVSERNPNGIVLRQEDFSSPNVYLNKELNEEEQKKLYDELLAKAKESEVNNFAA